MNIIEAIKERRSVRSFNGLPLTTEHREELLKAIEESYTFFGGRVTIRLKEFDLKGDFKPGTYGVIKDACNFFLVGMANDEESALTAGFRFEQIVLKAWQLGLGTCWIAATFKGSHFDRGETWPDGETLKIVCPVGVAAKKHLLEKVTRLAIGSDKRKPFADLFFTDNFSKPLSEDDKYAESLGMLRLAPSSTNSQPWRVLVDGDSVHFYTVPKSPASVLDCGIGICHFYEAEKFYEHKGSFAKLTAAPAAYSNWKYLTTYRRD